MSRSTSLLRILCASTFLTSIAHAEEQLTLDPLTVTAQGALAGGSRTVPSNAEAREIIQRTPGGVAVVPAEAFEDRYSVSFEDTLSLTPGVYAQQRFGEEVRLSIRGSGLSRGFHLRGLTLLQDGIPFNLADGSADFQEADSLATQRLEVFKGANALQYGSSSLGGAINIVSKTGHSNPGDQVRFEAGSESTYRANYQSGRFFEGSDYFASLTTTTSDGFREHDDQENIKFNGNFGQVLSEGAETRFYLSANVLDQELPGSVSLQTALNNREAADPSSITADQQRDIRSVRLANKTTFNVGDDDSVDIGAFVNVKDLFHPITPFVGVIDQESVDYGFFAQGSGEYQLSGHRNVYRLGVTSHFGEVDAKVFQNIGGSRGALLADADQTSRNVSLYGENSFYVTPAWALVTGAQLTWSTREVEDHVRPNESDGKTYISVNPKLGLLYEPSENVQLFANVSKSHEAPTFTELTQGGTVGFTPVDAQEAWTAEIGTRGSSGRFAWDVSIYRAWLKDELLQFTTGPSIPASTFNAGDTVHQGVELGFDVILADGIAREGDQLQWRNAYTYSDYYFDGDAQFRNNDIAGQPKHFYQTELRYDQSDWHVAVDWELSSDADVDFANTIETPGYGIIGFNAGYDVTSDIHLFVDGRNLLDQEFISTFSTIVNGAGNTSVFYPGEGRRFFAGVRVQF